MWKNVVKWWKAYIGLKESEKGRTESVMKGKVLKGLIGAMTAFMLIQGTIPVMAAVEAGKIEAVEEVGSEQKPEVLDHTDNILPDASETEDLKETESGEQPEIPETDVLEEDTGVQGAALDELQINTPKKNGNPGYEEGWNREDDPSTGASTYRLVEGGQVIQKWIYAQNDESTWIWQQYDSDEEGAQALPLEEKYYQIANETFYIFENGIQAKDIWVKMTVEEKECFVYFDSLGKEEKRTGFYTIEDKQYYLTDNVILKNDTTLGPDGNRYVLGVDGTVRISKWTKIGKTWYYSDSKGITLKNGWHKIKNKWYLMDEESKMQHDWKQVDGKWYYLGGSDDGAMKIGWQKIRNKWYYLSGNKNDGSMKIGWQKINNQWFYLSGSNGDGSMKIGWQKLQDKWYYLSGSANDGSMKTGWKKINNKWYYLGGADSGVMHYGWTTLNDKIYYLSGSANDGAMWTGWHEFNGKRYYFGGADDGAMKFGWQTVDGKQYYLYSDGAMASSCVIDDCYLDASGAKKDNPTTLEYWTFPCPSLKRVSSEFGYRSSPGGIGSTNHKGVDMAAPANSLIYAVGTGTVTEAGYNSSRGYYVQISHGNGLSTIYMHMISRPPVYAGQTVTRGQVIGYVGSTGISTGNHLHFGVSVNGTYVNPWIYLSRPAGI